MFLEKFLIPIEPIGSWCEKYNLEVKESSCSDCGANLVTDMPFFTKEFRGLFSKECSCGNKNTPFTFTFEDVVR